jgi:two-component system chemotaxis response regulator CheB
MTRRVVVMGASAGGVEALRAVVAGLPPDLPAAVVVVLHIGRGAPSALHHILDRSGPLPAVPAEQMAPLYDGVVYTAPADHHVLVVGHHLRLSTGPMENGHRPAIDPLFRSVALAFGPGAVGVVLSGTRDDGAAGLAAIAARGGTAVVQDPEEALHSGMPAHALEQVPEALVHPAAKIGPVIGEQVNEPAAAIPGEPGGLLAVETEIAAVGAPTTDVLAQSDPSPYSCPTCHVVLFELPGNPTPRFRCRVGHAWSPASLVDEQNHAAEDALWAAVRTLDEKAAMLERLADGAARRGRVNTAGVYVGRAAQARRQADEVRALLDHEKDLSPLDDADAGHRQAPS